MILDCCHAGTGMDLAYRWNPYSGDDGWQLDPGGYYSEADVMLGEEFTTFVCMNDVYRIYWIPLGSLTSYL